MKLPAWLAVVVAACAVLSTAALVWPYVEGAMSRKKHANVYRMSELMCGLPGVDPGYCMEKRRLEDLYGFRPR
jgi:hypothetical protein